MPSDGMAVQLMLKCTPCEVEEWVYKDEGKSTCWLCGKKAPVVNSREVIDQRPVDRVDRG